MDDSMTPGEATSSLLPFNVQPCQRDPVMALLKERWQLSPGAGAGLFLLLFRCCRSNCAGAKSFTSRRKKSFVWKRCKNGCGACRYGPPTPGFSRSYSCPSPFLWG